MTLDSPGGYDAYVARRPERIAARRVQEALERDEASAARLQEAHTMRRQAMNYGVTGAQYDAWRTVFDRHQSAAAQAYADGGGLDMDLMGRSFPR